MMNEMYAEKVSVIDSTTRKKFLFLSKFVSSTLKSNGSSFFEAIILMKVYNKVNFTKEE